MWNSVPRYELFIFLYIPSETIELKNSYNRLNLVHENSLKFQKHEWLRWILYCGKLLVMLLNFKIKSGAYSTFYSGTVGHYFCDENDKYKFKERGSVKNSGIGSKISWIYNILKSISYNKLQIFLKISFLSYRYFKETFSAIEMQDLFC